MKKGCSYNKQDLVNNNMKTSVNLGEFLPLITTTTGASNVVGMSEQQSSRWNPTAEQLLALEEMYRRGTRTPSADQIQQIASQLRRFGKIEGKNVFYWFQNHKARERQKRRREADTSTTTTSKLRSYIEQAPVLDNKHSSGLKPSFQLQQKKNLLLSSPNCTEKLEGDFDMHIGLGTEESTVKHNACCSTEKNDTWSDPKTRLLNNNIINEESVEVETLELFPVFKNEESNINNNNNNNNNRRRKVKMNNNKDKDKDKDRKVPTRPINNKQYFEFLN